MADELNTRRRGGESAVSGIRGAQQGVRIEGGIVTKRKYADRAALLREVAWLQRLPEPLRARFPQVLAVRVGNDFAEYDMPFCALPKFAELLVCDQITTPDAVAATHRIASFAFEQLYTQQSCAAPAAFFVHNYLDPIEERAQAVHGASRRFDRLLRVPSFIVNGQSVENPRHIARRIALDAELLARLAPPRLTLVHGDFRFDNFLIDPRGSDFMLLDPRGVGVSGESAGDYLEDLARLRTSTLGLADLVRASRMQLRIDDTRVSCECARVAPVAARTLSAIDGALLRFLPAWAESLGDRNVRLRLRFLTPLLLIADAALELAPSDRASEGAAVALFATGARLLQAAIDAYAAERSSAG
jgi:hypothetical protein